MKTAQLTNTRQVKAYTLTRLISQHFADRAFKLEEGAFQDAVAAVIFCAFTIEAFCNHMGFVLGLQTPAFEKKTPREKLAIVSGELKFNLDFGRRPFQTFTDVWWFRNTLAHSKTEVLTVERTIPFSPVLESHELPKDPVMPTEWEAFCTPENVARAMQDIEVGLRQVHDSWSGSKDVPFDKEARRKTVSWRTQPQKDSTDS